MTTFDYLLRANLYLLLFFGCYYLLLRRHTFFALNRLYLLASVGLALGLPFVQLPGETVAALPAVSPQLLTGVVISPGNLIPAGPDWVSIGWWTYGLVAFGLLVRLAWRTIRLLNFIRRNPQHTLPHYTLVQPADPQTPTFSFFRYMVLSPADTQAEPVRAHELVHIRQWHSADVLLFEVVQAVLWFNPVVLAYRVAIRQVHEFLADQAAAARHRSEYANYLVSYALGDQPDLLTNSFFKPSLLTARLKMLHQRATSHWALSKYALVLPLASAMLMYMQHEQEADKVSLQSAAIDRKINELRLERLKPTWLRHFPFEETVELKTYKHFFVDGHEVSRQSLIEMLHRLPVRNMILSEGTQTVYAETGRLLQ